MILVLATINETIEDEDTNLIRVSSIQKEFVWKDGVSEPEDVVRVEAVLETEIEKDLVDPDTDEVIGSLTASEILAIIETRARTVLQEEHTSVDIYAGDFNVRGPFEYGTDFFMGDLVVCNIQGVDITGRVIELVRSYSNDGETTYVAMDFTV